MKPVATRPAPLATGEPDAEPPALTLNRLTVGFGRRQVLREVTLLLNPGERVAVLGPNGAGKTTTVEILEGLRTRTSGEVSVLGVDPAEATAAWRERIGVVLQGATHEGDFTASEIVTMWSAYYRSPRPTAEVLEWVGLADAAGTRTRRLSGGQKQRLAVALALVGDPELVFLDEPTTGFDPAARREAWHTIESLPELGVTVLLTTHYMEEADHLADRIVVISAGRVAADGTAAELAAQAALGVRIGWDAAELGPSGLPEGLRAMLRKDAEPTSPAGQAAGTAAAPAARQAAGHTHELVTSDVGGVVRELLRAADAADTSLDSLSVRPPTLEDTYLALTESESPPDSPDPAAAAGTAPDGPDGRGRRRRRSGAST